MAATALDRRRDWLAVSVTTPMPNAVDLRHAMEFSERRGCPPTATPTFSIDALLRPPPEATAAPQQRLLATDAEDSSSAALLRRLSDLHNHMSLLSPVANPAWALYPEPLLSHMLATLSQPQTSQLLLAPHAALPPHVLMEQQLLHQQSQQRLASVASRQEEPDTTNHQGRNERKFYMESKNG